MAASLKWCCPLNNFYFLQRKSMLSLTISTRKCSKQKVMSNPWLGPRHTARLLGDFPEKIENDWIGPPDKVSNIRHVKFHVPKDETVLERQYREQRQAVLDWHHQFWTEHNKSFFTMKEEFIQHKLAEKQLEGKHEGNQSLSPEELSVFYKKFLDDNYKTHIQYNKEWYKKNISLLWPALKVNASRLFKKTKSKKEES